MAIVYRTSDSISLEEMHTKNLKFGKFEQHGTFIAPCFKYLATNEPEYGVYSASNDKQNLILVAHHNTEALQRGSLGYLVRAFQVSHQKKQPTIDQLLKNKGALDNEYRRIHAVTHNFQYSIELDKQKHRFYNAEEALLGIQQQLLRGTRNKIIDELNENVSPRNPIYVLTPREAAIFGAQVLEGYGIHDIRLESGVNLPGSAAECGIIDEVRRMFFARNCRMRLGFHPKLPITRGAILHEIAHALELREFGGFGHGPTFVLIYCELLSKFADLDFVTTFDYFVSKGLKVANPIYSDRFFMFDKSRRNSFKDQYQEIAAR